MVLKRLLTAITGKNENVEPTNIPEVNDTVPCLHSGCEKPIPPQVCTKLFGKETDCTNPKITVQAYKEINGPMAVMLHNDRTFLFFLGGSFTGTAQAQNIKGLADTRPEVANKVIAFRMDSTRFIKMTRELRTQAENDGGSLSHEQAIMYIAKSALVPSPDGENFPEGATPITIKEFTDAYDLAALDVLLNPASRDFRAEDRDLRISDAHQALGGNAGNTSVADRILARSSLRDAGLGATITATEAEGQASLKSSKSHQGMQLPAASPAATQKSRTPSDNYFVRQDPTDATPANDDTLDNIQEKEDYIPSR